MVKFQTSLLHNGLAGFSLLFAIACHNQVPSETASQSAPMAPIVRPAASPIIFLSTQLNPVEEAAKMRNVMLKDFPGKVDFRPNDNSFIFSQLDSQLKGRSDQSILVGALHGDLVTLFEGHALQSLDDIAADLEQRGFSAGLLNLARLDGQHLYYIPWMQASFVMVANKLALPYLPAGASLDSLSYDQLLDWARNITEQTGKKLFGLPAGSKGLMHRWLQGYLYPSFTNSTLLKFRSPEAQEMWAYLRNLWGFVHPGSLVYSTMAEPLLAGDIWIAWDHTARLMKAFAERPGDFIAFPAPVGPKGSGFMAVISGLAIPAGQTNPADAATLIDFLTQPVIQGRTLAETGFFPVVRTTSAMPVPPHLEQLQAAIDRQTNASEAIPTLLPIGLGEQTGDFNNIFMLTFSEIILEGKPIAAVLNAKAATLQAIVDSQNARCWLPDISDRRPCKIE